MTRRDDPLRLLDPVDSEAPEPDAEALLERILREPVAARAPRTHRRRPLRFGIAAAGATAAGLALVLPGGGDEDVLAAALRAVSEPGTILHYVRTDAAGGELEVWQAADGSRQRIVTRAPGIGLLEEVDDGDRSQNYVADTNTTYEYDERPQDPAAPGGVGSPRVGDPRTLLERANAGDADVEALGEGTVRGVDVLRFRVGRCAVRIDHSPGTTGLAMETEAPYVVSIAKDGSVPVRIEQPACRAPNPEGEGTYEVAPGPTADYPVFEVLPGTAANRERLEMSPHPGAKVLDGEDIDAQEERAEQP